MGQMKPTGSEKLPFDEKIKRIVEIATYREVKKQPVKNPNATTHYLKETYDGCYGVVREKDGYYVKFGLDESALDYIGGMRMKNKNRFSSYAEAVKRLELIARPITEQDKKYVLNNKDANVDEDPTAEPSMGDTPPAPPADDATAPEGDDAAAAAPPADGSDMAPAPEGGDQPEMGEHMKGIQKLTGKLGQRLRDMRKDLDSDDIKYVLNSIISAIDLDKLSDEDKDDIVNRFDDTDYNDSPDVDVDNSDMDTQTPSPDAGDNAGEEAPAPPADGGGEEAPADDEKDLGESDDIFESFAKFERLIKGLK